MVKKRKDEKMHKCVKVRTERVENGRGVEKGGERVENPFITRIKQKHI
jgi:hypothetical protein